ncbi:hypothetical protein D9M72_304920 [compost metagenome]
MGSQVAIVVQGGFVVGLQAFHHPVAEFPGPGGDHLGAGVPVQLTQIVGDAARADQQDVALTQAGQGLADTGLERGAEAAGQRQLGHRDIGLGVHQRQRHPGAMVEWALRVDPGGKAGFVQQAGDFLGQLRGAGSRVLHGVERRREAVEVVPGFRMRAAAELQLMAFPVGGYHQDGLGTRQRVSQGPERRTACAGLQGEHGRAVGDEQAG